MGKRAQIKTENLCRLIHYILGYHPYEFGLVPDLQGFIPVKNLIKGINEEKDWKHVRHGHVNEILLGPGRDLFEVTEKGIRSFKREWVLDMHHPVGSLRGPLLTPIRRRAHAHVLEKGIGSDPGRPIILTHDRDMALRIGKRKDPKPVLIEVAPQRALRAGNRLYPFGDLFLARDISANSLIGPALSKADKKMLDSKEDSNVVEIPETQAGSFLLNPARDPNRTKRGVGKKTERMEGRC